MLDMGFINDMRDILGQVPSQRQTLCFSATMDDRTAQLVNDFMKHPVTISVKKKDVTDSIEQDVVEYKHTHKFETLTNLLEEESFKRVIIFGAMKHSVEKLSNELNAAGIKSESIQATRVIVNVNDHWDVLKTDKCAF